MVAGGTLVEVFMSCKGACLPMLVGQVTLLEEAGWVAEARAVRVLLVK
jgi:hypothetical protein